MDLPWGMHRQWEESEQRLVALLRVMGLDREALGRVAARVRARFPVVTRMTVVPGRSERRARRV